MFKWIMCLSLLLGYGTIEAHQPDLSSTLLVEQGKNKWALQIRAALTAFEYEIKTHFGDSSYATPEEFRGLVIKHIQENTSIVFNEANAVALQNGIVKLGHETTVSFEVVGTPETIESLVVKNSSFGKIARNQSAFIVFKEGFSKDQFTLNNDNKHTVELKVSDSKFELAIPIQTTNRYFLLIFAGILLALSIAYFIFKNKKTVISNSV